MDIVRIFSKLGYSHVGKIYIDGTKLKGNASAKRTKDRAGFEKWLSEIEEALKIMKEEERKKINLTDRDANHMKTGGSKDIRPGYNITTVILPMTR